MDLLPQNNDLVKTQMNFSVLSAKKPKSKRILKLGMGVVVMVLVAVGWDKLFETDWQTKEISKTLGETSQRIELNESLLITSENNKKGVNYQLTWAELTNEIILKGQKATAVGGRRFLIINVKLTNFSDGSIEVPTRDYVQLAVNDSPNQLTATVHNDPVEMLPLSQQQVQLGFSINESDRKLILTLGETGGRVIEIPLNF